MLAKMERLEGMAVRVVEDEVGDADFSLLSLIASWMLVLETRIVAALQWNRRCARKREVLENDGLRRELTDTLGGMDALEAWEERAGLALTSSRQAGDPGLRWDDGDGQGEPDPRPLASSRRRPGSPSEREFALARMPGRGARRMGARRVGAGRVGARRTRGPKRYETPISIWPCELMPERFARKWWTTEGSPNPTQSENRAKRDLTEEPERQRPNEFSGARSPETISGRATGGGPALNAGVCVLPGLVA